MASDKTLKFYKKSTAPSGAALGSVWFDTENRLINVKVADSGDKQWESYSGLQNASWVEASKTLRLVKADGTNLDINLSDVASAAGLTAVDNRLKTVETWKGTADSDITTLKTNVGNLQTEAGKNTAKLADINEGQTVKAVIDDAVKVEANRAKGVEGGHETRIGALETASGNHATAIENLQNALGEGGSVLETIGAEIAKLDATVGSQVIADGKHVAVEVVEVDGKLTGITVTENFEDITKAVNDEITRASNAEAALEKKVGTPVAVEGQSVYSESYTVGMDIKAAKDAAAAAQADIDAFLVAAETDNGVIDTLHEIQKYINEDDAAADALVKRVGANETAIGNNTTAIELLNNNAETAGSIAYAVAEAKKAIEGTFAEGETSKTLAAINADVAALEGLVGATSVNSQITAITNPLAERVSANETAVGTVGSRIATAKGEAISAVKGDVETLDTLGKVEDKIATMEQSITNNNAAAVKSVAGTTPKYITVSGDKEVSISIAPGAMGDDALVTGAVAKTYVDEKVANSWLWEEFA